MISGVLIGDRQLIARLERMPDAIAAEVVPEVQRLGYELERRVKADKLTGQVLHVRTGRLRSSITHGATDTRSRMVVETNAVFYYVGTNVSYGARWEYGYTGPETVKAFTRTQTMAFGRPIAAVQVDVRSFTRQINVRARPFLAPALYEMKPMIIERIRLAGVRGMQKALAS